METSIIMETFIIKGTDIEPIRVPIGFFSDEKDRDDAFHKYFILEKRWGIKGER